MFYVFCGLAKGLLNHKANLDNWMHDSVEDVYKAYLIGSKDSNEDSLKEDNQEEFKEKIEDPAEIIDKVLEEEELNPPVDEPKVKRKYTKLMDTKIGPFTARELYEDLGNITSSNLSYEEYHQFCKIIKKYKKSKEKKIPNSEIKKIKE